MPVVIPVCLSILSAISSIFSIADSNSNDFRPVIKSLAGHNSDSNLNWDLHIAF
jgi:hypothetical protein